jgi:hypothetical protein
MLLWAISLILVLLFGLLSIVGLVYYRMSREPYENQHVVARFADKGDAASRLASLSKMGQIVVDSPPPSAPGTIGAAAWQALKANYRQTLVENDSAWKKGHIAHTHPDGQISMAIRNKSGQFLPDDQVAFVFLHELAHVATFDMSRDKHSKEFWATFGAILDIAYDKKLLEPRDYAKKPDSYEGISIEYNPWFDMDWRSILNTAVGY